MEGVTKEHIKYQFFNVFSDLLSDLNSIKNVRPEIEFDNDADVITLAPEIKKSAPVSVYQTRGRPRKNDSEDRFIELRASRSKRKQPSGGETDIRASFNSSFDSVDNEGQIHVVADVHRDASQHTEAPKASFKGKDSATSDEIFDSLLDKKSKEIEISCSQESEDYFQVSKRPRKSYPGASAAKSSATAAGKRLSRGSIRESKTSPCLDPDLDCKEFRGQLRKNLGSLTSKSFSSGLKSPNSNESNSEPDKLRSSPGWSRVKAVAQDFKDSNYKKPLNISINKPRQSSSKSSSFVSGVTKAANSSLNLSTSDSDLSEIRYFDSPEAVKRCKLMKHVIDVTEKKVQDDDSAVVVDPLMKELAANLGRNRDTYVQNLINSASDQKSQKSDSKNIESMKLMSPSKNGEKIKAQDVISSKSKELNNECWKTKSPVKITGSSSSVELDNQETQFEIQPLVKKVYDDAQIKLHKSPLSTKKRITATQSSNQSKQEELPKHTNEALDSANKRESGKLLRSQSSCGKLFDPTQDEKHKKQVQSPLNSGKMFNSPQLEDERDGTALLKSRVTKENLLSKPSTDNSVVCLGEFEYESQPTEDVTVNGKLNLAREQRDVSEKDMLELSNCDVSETPLPNNERRKSIGLTRKKLNTKSQDLDDLLTQILPPSTRSSVSNEGHFEPTLPLISSQNICSRCRCSVTDVAAKQNENVNTKRTYVDSENQENSQNIPKKLLRDVCVQTDDVTIKEFRPSRESAVQTVPSLQSLETMPCKDLTEERLIRLKDEYILQTMKSLMIQASHKLTISDLYNLGLEQENERPRKKLKEITANHNQNSPRFEEDSSKIETLLLQPRPFPMNRSANDNPMHPPSDLKTPQNQLIRRKTASDMKYTAVSTPSSSERKVLDDAKFLNRSTVCLKDVTICETEEAHPSEDSIMKDVVPMAVEEDFPRIMKTGNKRENYPPKSEEIETSGLDVVRIRDKTNSSSSNDSLVLSSRKSVHRSLNFQSFFAKVNDNTCSSPSKKEDDNRNSEFFFSNDGSDVNPVNEDGAKKHYPMGPISDYTSSIPHNQHNKMELSEDSLKGSALFSKHLDTQKLDDGAEAGIIENSDDESIIQATPKKFGAESSLTPDMLSSQNSQVNKDTNIDLHPAPEAENSDICRHLDANTAVKHCSINSDNSVTKNTNSIDSQVNEIPSSILPTAEDCFPNQLERRNSLHNPQQPNQMQNFEKPSYEFQVNHNPSTVHPSAYIQNKSRNHVPESALSQDLNEQRRLFITTSGLQKSAMFAVQEFCKRFNCVYESEITERTTHLVVRTNQDRALSTMKFILAVAMHKLIVTTEWMSSCMKTGELLKESPFIPLSSSGRTGPLNSLMDKTNAMSSSLFRQFIVHVVGPFSNFKKENLLDVLLFSGARIAESYPDLAADKSRIRLVLINSKSAEDKCSFYCDIMQRYKAFVLLHDWAIESVSNYKVEPFSTHNPLPVAYSSEMSNNFQFPDYIKDQASHYFESHDDSFDETASELSSQV